MGRSASRLLAEVLSDSFRGEAAITGSKQTMPEDDEARRQRVEELRRKYQQDGGLDLPVSPDDPRLDRLLDDVVPPKKPRKRKS